MLGQRSHPEMSEVCGTEPCSAFQNHHRSFQPQMHVSIQLSSLTAYCERVKYRKYEELLVIVG